MKGYNNNLMNDDNSFNIKNIIIIIIIIMLVLVSFYFITKYVLEHKKDNTSVIESVIDREIIIFGQLLNRSDSEYYVIAYSESGKSKDIYNKYLDKYNKKENHIKVYEINLDEAFNKNFIATKSNITSDIEELKVSGDTLLKINNGSIEFYKEGTNDINSYLKEISA